MRIFVFIASAKIPEREGSISPSGQLPDVIVIWRVFTVRYYIN